MNEMGTKGRQKRKLRVLKVSDEFGEIEYNGQGKKRKLRVSTRKYRGLLGIDRYASMLPFSDRYWVKVMSSHLK